MPVKTFLLVLASVICAALFTIWIARTLANSLNLVGSSAVAAIPIVIVGLVLWRMIATREK